jgi:dihydrofolate reductase
MRKLIVSMNITLDGFMSGPDCELDWHFQHWTEDMAQCAREQLSRADTILLGRVTYTAMAAYWPAKTADLSFPRDDIDFASMMNSHAKIVFSTTLVGVDWNNARLAKRSVAAEIAHLKRQPGRDMITYGSGKLVDSLVQSGLVDEYQVWVHPVVLGKGKPLFRGPEDYMSMRLLQAKTFSSGVVLLCYSVRQRQLYNTNLSVT